jgi:hypothetical protein
LRKTSILILTVLMLLTGSAMGADIRYFTPKDGQPAVGIVGRIEENDPASFAQAVKQQPSKANSHTATLRCG